MEVLGAAIRNYKDIRGVRLPGSSEEIDEFSIAKAFEIARIFEKGSGSKLNLDKIEGMWFRSMAGRKDGPVNIKEN